MTARPLRRRRIPGPALTITALGLGMLAPGGCYTRVVDARGLGADSTELRESAKDDPRIPDRRIKRRPLLPDSPPIDDD